MPHLHDMEELVNSIKRKDAKDYMKEAMSCYMCGAYRGAIVLTFIALFDDILQKLDELGKVNKKAKKIFSEATNKRTDQEIFENYLIDQLKSNNLLTSLDTDFLNMLRSLRNKSAHPSGHHASAEEARYVIFESISRFMSQPILSTTQLADEILASLENENMFPSTNISITAKVVAQELIQIHHETHPYLISKLLDKTLSTDKTVAKNARYFLEGWARQANDSGLSDLKKYAIEQSCAKKTFNQLIIELLSSNGKLFHGLNDVAYHRLAVIIEEAIDEIDSGVAYTKLKHPISLFKATLNSVGEDLVLDKLKSQLKKVIEKFPYSAYFVDCIQKHPKLQKIYTTVLIAKAGSTDFGTANLFVKNISEIEDSILTFISEEDAFRLVVGVIRAAKSNAFSAIDMKNSNFSSIQKIRQMAFNFVTTQNAQAIEISGEVLNDAETIATITAYLQP